MPKVRKIHVRPLVSSIIQQGMDGGSDGLRVAAYARVSTTLDEQNNSFQAQKDYYEKLINKTAGWIYAGIYADRGISGISTDHREGFRQLMEDCRAGKVDRILTKSVSRFARNTVDSLNAIRELKSLGIGVEFEKENIWSFDGKGELLLTIMSSLAQEESRSISENVRWGQRKKAADGKYSLNYKHFLGYDKGEDGTLVINEEQAKIVRRIFGEFLAGNSAFQIAKNLTEDGIPTPAGKKKWHYTTVRSILSNETYMGDKLLQKTYTIDFLSKDRLKNTGQVPQYYVEQDHAAIIPPDTFRRVQDELERRKEGHPTGRTIFSRRIYCGECGQIYGSKVWHSNDPYRKVVWQCNDKFKGKKCSTPTLTEEKIRAAFEEVLRKLGSEKEEIVSNLRGVLREINCRELEERKEELEKERDDLADLFSNERATLGQEQELSMEFDQLSEEITGVQKSITEKKRKKRRIREFIKALEESGEEFSETDWCVMVEKVTVFKEKMIFLLTSGAEVEV